MMTLPTRHRFGFSAIELLIALAVLAVLLVIAAPSFLPFFDRQRVRSIASTLNTDLQYARSEAVRTKVPVTVSFSAGSSPWCYGLRNDANACDCLVIDMSAADACNIKVVSGGDFERVSMAVAGGGGLTIEPRQGRFAATAGGGGMASTVDFASTRTTNAQLKLGLNIMGRIELCSPDGTLAGYPPC